MTNTDPHALASLQGKVAIVTGGTQGLGAAVAATLAERGAQGIVICGRNAAKGTAQVARLNALGTQAVYVQADLEKLTTAVGWCRQLTPPLAAWMCWSTPLPSPTAAAFWIPIPPCLTA